MIAAALFLEKLMKIQIGITIKSGACAKIFFAKQILQYNFSIYGLHSNKSNHVESLEVHPDVRLLVNCIALQPDIDL